jgi:ethanolamine ammonia-lyase small subunit
MVTSNFSDFYVCTVSSEGISSAATAVGSSNCWPDIPARINSYENRSMSLNAPFFFWNCRCGIIDERSEKLEILTSTSISRTY